MTISIHDVSEQRKRVFLDRYAAKNKTGKNIESDFEQMWGRVAIALADESREYEGGAVNLSAPHYNDYFDILKDFKFVPGGRILAGAGVGTEQTFYNCYVIPVEPNQYRKDAGNDSREAIFDTIGTMVDIMSRGGGVGINWSVLRPSGSYLSRVSGSSSGPVGWMDVASKAVGEVEQGGSRRGAAMFMLDDWHPDILNFINAKRDLGKITNANVSVAISDDFMKAVKDDALWLLEFPSTGDSHYNSEWDGDMAKWRSKGYGVTTVRSVRARQIWDAIIQGAWDNGEPGVVFLDRYNKQSTGADIERIISVNPCGEQGLGAYSVCNLGSMNLAAYVNTKAKEGEHKFNWPDFIKDVGTAVRFLDAVIDKSFYWDDRSKDVQRKLRRIGLGTMGLADALIAMGLRYGSDDAVKFTEAVYQTMKDTAIETSIKLAEEKGPAEGYTEEIWNRPYLREYLDRRWERKPGFWTKKPLRNLFFLTQAPTGTTATLAGVNSGIEPFFALRYTRKDRTGTHKVDIPAQYGFSEEDALPDYFVTANDVTVEEHIAMQAAVQKYVDSSVSKTINAPNSHKIEDVDKAYMLAYDSNLKGVAYFRDGCGRDQVLSTEKPIEQQISEDRFDALNAAEDRIAQLEEQLLFGSDGREWRRPDIVTGYTKRVNTSMGTMYLTVNSSEDGDPVEVFVNVGKAGSDVMALGEAIGRLVSLNLQNGVTAEKVASQLTGVGGTSSFNPGLVHALGKALDSHQASLTPNDKGSEVKSPSPVYLDKADPLATGRPLGAMCPDCRAFSLIRTEGCLKCLSCDYAAC